MAKKTSDAQAEYWLLLHLSGKSFRQIARLTGKDREAIARNVREAALRNEGIQAKLNRELLSGVIDFYRDYIERGRKLLREGESVDIRPIERLMLAMGIFQSADCS